MILAVPYENGQVFQHFGHMAAFKLYDVENGKILRTETVQVMENGHGALVAVLVRHNVETLICGGIGSSARNALLLSGIKLRDGVTGSADEAVRQYIRSTLGYIPTPCCGNHSCN